MTSFDQYQHPRNAAGTATGGQFAEKAHSAPEAVLEEWSEESSRTDEWLDQADDLLDEVSHIPGHPLADLERIHGRAAVRQAILDASTGALEFNDDYHTIVTFLPGEPWTDVTWDVERDRYAVQIEPGEYSTDQQLDAVIRAVEATRMESAFGSMSHTLMAANNPEHWQVSDPNHPGTIRGSLAIGGPIEGSNRRTWIYTPAKGQ